MVKILIIAALILSGCATAGRVPGGRFLQVQPGMSREAVIALLGEPGSRSFQRSSEALVYCKRPPLIGDAIEYSIIWLRSATVVAMTTDRRKFVISGTCDSYPPVDWSREPE